MIFLKLKRIKLKRRKNKLKKVEVENCETKGVTNMKYGYFKDKSFV